MKRLERTAASDVGDDALQTNQGETGGTGEPTGRRSEATVASELSGCCRAESLPLKENSIKTAYTVRI